MSWQALNWATRQRVGRASAKHVLMVLANYADENGSCFPSQAPLALDTEMSERAVRDQLDFLECRGAFNRQASRQGNRRGRNRYHLAIDKDLSAPGADAGGEAAEEEGLPANSAGREPAGLNRQMTRFQPANPAGPIRKNHQ